MVDPPPIAAYRWMSFYLTNLANEVCTISDVDFNISSDLDSLSKILDGESEPEVLNWLKTLKSAFYEAEDMLDLLQLLESQLEKWLIVVRILPSCPLFRRFERITEKIFKRWSQQKCLSIQMNKLRDLVSESSFFCGALGFLDNQVSVSQRRETSPNLITRVFGCDGELGSIRELLLGQMCPVQGSSSCQGYCVVTIVGPSSSGKTTLAQYIFNDERIVQHFETRIWLSVSQELNVFHHTKKMVENILKEKCPRLENLDVLQRILEDEVRSKNTLVVLDDVWGKFANKISLMDNVSDSGLANSTSEVEQIFVDEVHWEQLLAPFSRISRCKILVTSQSQKLPLPLRSSHVFMKQPMEEQSLFSLLMHSAFGDCRDALVVTPDIERIGHEIVQRRRSPIEARLIGSQLRAQSDVESWQKVLEWVSLDCVSKLYLTPTDIYLQLKEPLKRCLLLCSIFPKGYKHDMNSLIQLWVAQCFIKPDSVRRAEDIGKEYFQELLSFSIFKPMHDQESDLPLYTMDDHFHHLADCLSADDCFRLEMSDGIVIPSFVYHLSIPSAKLMEHKSNICTLHHLRTLILFGSVNDGSDGTYEILEEIFSNLKRLRAVDVSFYNGNILPKNISNLKHLRYLHISTAVTKLPNSIHRLRNLQFLKPKCDVKGSLIKSK